MKKISLLLLILSFFSIVNAEDWPIYRKDIKRSGIASQEFEAKKLGISWIRENQGLPKQAWGGPAKWDSYHYTINLKNMRNYDPVYFTVASEGRVYYASTFNCGVYCLDAGSGQVLWSYFAQAPVRITPSLYEGNIYFGADDGIVYCLDAESGKEQWTYNFSKDSRKVLHDGRLISSLPVRTGVVPYEGKVYFGLSLFPWQASWLCCLDSVTGKPVYLKEYAQDEMTMEGSPVIFDNMILMPQGRIAPKLFKLEDGSFIKNMPGSGCYAIVNDEGHTLAGPRTRDGLFEAGKSSGASLVSYDDGNAVLSDNEVTYLLTDESLTAYKEGSSSEIWRLNCEYPYDLIKSGNTLFIGGVNSFAAVNAENGSIINEFEVDGRVYGFTVYNNQLFVSTDSGKIYCFDESGRRDLFDSKNPAPYPNNLFPVFSGIKDRFVFGSEFIEDQKILNAAGSRNGLLEGRFGFSGEGFYRYLEADGERTDLLIDTDMTRIEKAADKLSVLARVRIDKDLPWGGLAGVINREDDGEKGWLLGYSGGLFSFTVNTTVGSLTITDVNQFEKGKWYSVAGVYNGKKLELFVDGVVVASADLSGKILYPDSGYYQLGAFRDNREFTGTAGAFHEFQVYHKALSAKNVQSFSDPAVTAALVKNSGFPEADPEAGPVWKFVDEDSAVVEWVTSEDCSSVVFTGPGHPEYKYSASGSRKHHSVRVDGVKRNSLYKFYVVFEKGGNKFKSKTLEADTYFNFETIEYKGKLTRNRDLYADTLSRCAGAKGLIVLIGSENVNLVRKLASVGHRVICLETDSSKADSFRMLAASENLYGDRVTCLTVEKFFGKNMPVRFANAAGYADSSYLNVESVSALKKYVQPVDGVVLLPSISSEFKEFISFKDLVTQKGFYLNYDFLANRSPIPDGFSAWAAPELEGMSDWTHLYGTAENSAYTGETLQGAESTGDLFPLWIGRPGPRFQTDRNGRKQGPLAVSGRLFWMGDNKIACLDQYNGTVLWSFETDETNRMNMPRDCANWCADEKFLYLALSDKCWKIEAETGKINSVFNLARPEKRQHWSWDWGYIARQGNSLFGTAEKKGSQYINIWGNAIGGWYDAQIGSVTHRVCSDAIFSKDAETGETNWKYENGVILNSSIMINDGKIFFAESQAASLNSKRRLSHTLLFGDLKWVCLDSRSGNVVWRESFSPGNAVTMLGFGYSDGVLVSGASGFGKYTVRAFDASNGKRIWSHKYGWPGGDHGKHMSRPVIVNGKIYMRPRYFDLHTGKELGRNQPVQQGGCSTYTATSNLIIYRSGSVSLWSHSSEQEETKFNRLRQDCWISIIPAGGMILSPEGGGGCHCGTWLETSIGFMPFQTYENIK